MSTQGFQSSKSTDLEAEDTANSPDIDEIFSLLSNSRRRAALRIMFEHERLDFPELVTKVAEIDYELPADQISSDERHTVYVSMYQTHLEKLVEVGVLHETEVLNGSQETGTVSLGHNADVMAEWISKIDGEDSLGSKLKRAVGF